MRNHHLALPLLLVLAVSAACIETEQAHRSPASSDPTVQITDGAIPCDVAQVIATNCGSCHNTSTKVAGVDLTTYASLSGPSTHDPSVSQAARAVIRMRDTAMPMPPTGQIADTEISIVDNWVKAGLPKGACSNPSMPPTVTVQCTSNQTYTGGTDGGGDMYPGRACIACHQSGGGGEDSGPTLQFAGTVFPTTHEPDDCIGKGGATVVVTDANGRQYSENVRASGNFFLKSDVPIAFPISAEIHQGTKVLKMNAPVPSGDCNACHTTLGANGAPGRLVGP
jgi:mono/diheme cytochrome c family protein